MTVMRADHSKSELAYQAIRSRILDGTYPPERRLVLNRLADELEISSLPIREALRRLEAEGLVDFTRNVGAVVASIDPGQYVETLEVLTLLEAAATAESAPHLTAEQLGDAKAISNRMRACLGDGDLRGFTLLNRAFHEKICSACPNAYLLASMSREWTRLEAIRRSTFGMMPGRAEQSLDEHDRIIALIEAGASGSEIERAARDHKLHTLQAFEARDPQRTHMLPSLY
jgi:DNA-binding GntR family transcriptional regulator